MSDIDAVPPFYRDRLTPAQRRRAEALILVATMWPGLGTESAVIVADWIYRGKATVKVND